MTHLKSKLRPPRGAPGAASVRRDSGSAGKPSLYIVDALNFLFRAFHALPPLTTTKGLQTGAIYGLSQMLLRIEREHRPTHLCVVYDAPGDNFRNEIFPEYKAHRPPMPPELAAQMALTRQVVEAFGLTQLEIPGFEADDIIATLAKVAKAAGMQVVICSSDKDLMQLCDDYVSVLDTMKNRRLGVEEVREKFGVPPELVGDVLALMGDSIDNVPGVVGIGPKTAAELINKFGSLDALLAGAAEIKGKRGASIVEARESIRLSRELVRLRDDVPLPKTLAELHRVDPDQQRLGGLFRELEFSRLAEQLTAFDKENASKAARPGRRSRRPPFPSRRSPSTPSSTAPRSPSWRGRSRRRARSGFPLFTTASRPCGAISSVWRSRSPPGAASICRSTTATSAPRSASPRRPSATWPPCWRRRRSPSTPTTSRRWRCCSGSAGWLSAAWRPTRCWRPTCSTPRARTTISTSSPAPRGSPRRRRAAAGWGRGPRPARARTSRSRRSGRVSAPRPPRRWRSPRSRRPQIVTGGFESLYRDMELPLADLLAKVECRGILLDVGKLREIGHEVGTSLVALESEIHAIAGGPFNIASNKQLADVLFGKLSLPVGRRTKTGPSTDADTLEELAALHPVPAKIVEFRALSKLRGTYIDALPALVNPATGRLHTSFNQAVAATGRLSSSNPNLQNIPIRTELGRRIREAFIAKPGHLLVSADYSQIELRILAHFSQDPAFLEAFRSGQDIHLRTAAEVFGVPLEGVTGEQRRIAKAINFGLVFGQSDFGLAQVLRIPRAQARAYIDSYFARYAGVRAYMERAIADARAAGAVSTLLGRRRPLPEIRATRAQDRAYAERIARNTPIQGSAADLLKLAMIRVERGITGKRGAVADAALLLTVHDELVFEVPEAGVPEFKQWIKNEMEMVFSLAVPLVVDVGAGATWGAAH